MSRATFVTLYTLGIIAALYSGNPWSRVNYVLDNPSNPGAALTFDFFVSLLMPLALIVIAAIRGRVVGRPRLVLLPLLAFLVSALGFLYGWISRALAGGQPSVSGFLPMPVAIGIGVVSAFVPIVLQVLCCVQGASESQVQAAKARNGA